MISEEAARRFRPLIWTEGIIGAGKTTFSREVAKRLQLRLIEEPVGDNPYLECFYQDQKKWAFGFQMFMLHRRYLMQRLAADEATGLGGYQGAILDRSLSGDRVFAKMHMECGNIERIDWDTYEMAYDIMCRTLLPPTLLVFLDIQPETAHARMKKRGREAEKEVPLSYLESLRRGYQDLLTEAERGLLPWAHAVRVCRIPWDPDTLSEQQWDQTARTIREACRMV